MIGVSVIIPFYSQKVWLKEALDSVLRQTYTSIEIIVINDGSNENIDDIVTLYKNVSFYRIENSGPGKARNYGIERAKGRFIVFLDSDDLWEPTKLSDQVNFMESNGFKWSHTNYKKFFNDNPKVTQNVNCEFKGRIIPLIFLYNPIATPCVMIENSILIENGELRFSEKLRIGEDSYFWFKLAELHALGHLDDFLTLVRMRGLNAAKQAYLQLKSKADNFDFVKSNKQWFPKKIHYLLVIFGFNMCKINLIFVDKISKVLNLNSSKREVLSKIIYALPYIYLKIVSHILYR